MRHTNIALLAALEKSEQISFVNVRHEQIAAHAADGYARVTKRAGVVLGDDVMYTDYAAIARAYGIAGIKVDSAAESRPALEHAIALGAPVVIDVSMVNVPTPTTGHWNILDIYSPGEKVEHVATH